MRAGQLKNALERLFLVCLATAFFAAGVCAAEKGGSQARADPIPELDCVIEPSEIVDLGSAVPGVVQSIHAFRSDMVEKGAVVVELESTVEQAALALAKTRARLNTGIELRQENATLGHLTQKRNQELLKKSVISLQEMDTLKTETRMAELQVRQEKDNKRIAGLEYRRARAVLHRRTIRSPVDGVVMERFKSVGEYVEDEPMLRVAQLDPLHVEVIVPVDYLGRITPGMRARVTPVVVDSGPHLATVDRVDVVSDAASGTFGVQLSLANPKYEIPAGLRCHLSFLPPEETNSQEVADEPAGPVIAQQADNTPTKEIPEPESIRRPAEPPPERGPKTAVPAVVQPADVASAEETPELDLVSGSSRPPSDSKPETVVPVYPPEPPMFCYTVGPVADETLATRIFDGLEAHSDALVLRNETVRVVNGYLVLAAPDPDPQAPDGLIARLKKAGVNDHILLKRGGNEGRVALGVYNGPQSAAMRQKALAAKGFETEVMTRRKTVTQFWLDGALEAGPELAVRAQKIAASLSPSASFKQIDCPQQLANL